MADKNKILQSIYAVVAETNEDQPAGGKLDASPDTQLFGAKGKLDSMGLVNFVVAVEQRINDDFAAAISVTDEKAMSQRNSPFRTIGTLADYLAELLKDAGN